MTKNLETKNRRSSLADWVNDFSSVYLYSNYFFKIKIKIAQNLISVD